MATTLTEKHIDSLRAFSEGLEQYMLTAAKRALWYRGCGNVSHKLLPSLFRHPTITTVEKLLELETELIGTFRARSLPYVQQLPDSDLELMFLMQHHGVPTRLLDWTENPYIALFFALSKSVSSGTDAAIWALDPNRWNEKALEDVAFKEAVLLHTDTILTNGYAPKRISDMKTAPVAMYGIHNSRRIVAQRGVFMIYGKAAKPMEDLYQEAGYPADCLVKFVCEASKVPDLLNDLIAIGTTDSVLYPDLDGLAREIKRRAGFPIEF
jgi:hypothetical protein